MVRARKPTPRPSAARGRPRDGAADAAILKTTLELLASVGLHGMTIEAIAAAAGVSRPTIYRRWRSREEIVVAALMAAVRPLLDPDTGDTRRDLFSMLAALAQDLDEHVGLTVLGVHAALRSDAALAGLLRTQYLAPRAVVLSRVLKRGVQQGDLRADLSFDLMRDLVFGPLIYHLLITGKPLRKRDVALAFEAIWSAIAARGVV
jgi:AcrR family transcriptional regulator